MRKIMALAGISLLILMGAVGLNLVDGADAAAVDVFQTCDTTGNSDTTICKGTDDEALFGAEGVFSNIIKLLLFIIGAVSVLMIIVGGLRYVISAGDQSQLTAAKNTILYAVIGLVIAMFAYGIVTFVVDSIV